MGFFDPIKGGTRSCSSIYSGFIPTRRYMSLSCPGWGSSANYCQFLSAKPLYGYKWVAMSSLGIALTGFLVWGHHMFALAWPNTCANRSCIVPCWWLCYRG